MSTLVPCAPPYLVFVFHVCVCVCFYVCVFVFHYILILHLSLHDRNIQRVSLWIDLHILSTPETVFYSTTYYYYY